MSAPICVRCGKTISSIHYFDEWVYRDGNGFYCAWHCYNHRNDDKQTQHPRSRTVVQCDKSSGLVIATFNSITEAADHINGEAKTISRACTTDKPYKGYLWRYKNDVS